MLPFQLDSLKHDGQALICFVTQEFVNCGVSCDYSKKLNHFSALICVFSRIFATMAVTSALSTEYPNEHL